MIARGSLPKLQQAHLHDEDSQHDENVRDNVPEVHGVPLEGGMGSVCERQRKELKRVERTVDVPIMMPCGSSKSTEVDGHLIQHTHLLCDSQDS